MQPSASSVGQQAVPATVQTDAAAPSTNTSAEQVQASVQLPSAPQSEDLYTYQKCTIMIVVQLRPQVEDGRPRAVLLSVQNGTTNKEDLPLYHLLSSEDELGGPFPPALVSLLEVLQQELPARKQRHEQRVANKSTIGESSTKAVQQSLQVSAKDAGKQKKVVTAATTFKPVPPVLAPATPLPKENLMLGGLFDDL